MHFGLAIRNPPLENTLWHIIMSDSNKVNRYITRCSSFLVVVARFWWHIDNCEYILYNKIVLRFDCIPHLGYRFDAQGWNCSYGAIPPFLFYDNWINPNGNKRPCQIPSYGIGTVFFVI